MYEIDLSSKKALVFGVSNERSIGWHVCEILHRAGASIAIAYQSERFKSRVEKLAKGMNNVMFVQCDVSFDDQIEQAFKAVGKEYGRLDYLVHSIAFAQREDLGGDFSHLSRSGFQTALEISAYSLIPLARNAATLMGDKGGSITTMTFQASERVFPGYNIMGTAKAALENEVRQLAAEYGSKNIRVNAVSAGPLDTLSSRGIHGFLDMKKIHAEKSPLGRNITHQEVAKTVLYLCSDLSSGVTGAIIPVDAGYRVMAA